MLQIDDATSNSRLHVRLAENSAEVRAAQELRYRVFYDEMGAKPTAEMAAERADIDDFDEVCDHLLVLDRDKGEGAAGVVGTYRLMLRKKAESFGRFYTAGEFDISRIVGSDINFMELGRSCVDAAYRNRATMNLLWAGIAGYVKANDVELMFGCASLPGTDVDALAASLAYLHHWHSAPEQLRPRALDSLRVDMNRMPKDGIDPRRAWGNLAPLIKGYLRLGGYIGDGAVVDHQFNTTDVCVIVKTDQVTERYIRHYDRSGVESMAQA